jgi:predicted Zn-dependent protease
VSGQPVTTSEQAWLAQARALLLRSAQADAEALVARALLEHPRSFELRRIRAGICRQTGCTAAAESLLTELLAERPDDAGTAFALAGLLIDQCRSSAAAAVMRASFEHARHGTELAIQAIELLDGCHRPQDAAAIAEAAIATDPDDPRLHAYAGMLEIQLGDFERARVHLLHALEHAPQACEWHVPYGLASMQRYDGPEHPDFARFRACLLRRDLSDKARSSLLFALAKAHDDIGDFVLAAEYSRQANALAHALTQWSSKHWRRAVDARLQAGTIARAAAAQPDFTPVFVLGMPRSGTTLVAELLARHPQVCNRGETPWLAALAQRAELVVNPDQPAIQRAADAYAARLRQDDTRGMRWFIDKQPLNFRYVDLILALFPSARIVYCRRNARDNALSLWMQSFAEEVQGFAYDFADIARVMRDCERLMAHWRKRYADSIHEVCYEQLTAAPEAVIAGLATWLQLPAAEADTVAARPAASINTASVWQARQPVYARSTGRWRNYAACLPELLDFRADDPAGRPGQLRSNGNSR